MSKGLKALERIKNHCVVSREYFYKHFGKDLDLVEKELKALEIIRRNPYEVVASMYEFDSYKEMLEEWWQFSDNKCHFKSEEEYKLVKEVLSK